ncbi:MAG: hypothetical protein AB1589_26550 [Cyanobacteriota bacterium]
MGASSAFLSWIIAGFQVRNQFFAIALLLTLLAAFLGGYLYKSKFNVQNSK